MKDSKHKLMVEHLDNKLSIFVPLLNTTVPDKGWIHVIRTAFKMTYQQFGERLGITAPSARHIEKREREGSLTLKSLEEAGKALNMKLVYGFVPMDGSIERTIENRAKELATEIVRTTSNTMALEDQENSKDRLKRAIEDKTKQIIDDMPRYLWD